MRRRRHQRHRIESEIPTSSTGDIAFLLIIFFMVTATFAVSKGLPFELPSESEGNEGEESVIIELHADGTIVVDCSVMNQEQILDYLEPRLSRNARKPVVIYAHEGASYQALVTAYEALYRAPQRGLPEPDVQIPTPEDIERYIAMFGVDPFAAHCQG